MIKFHRLLAYFIIILMYCLSTTHTLYLIFNANSMFDYSVALFYFYQVIPIALLTSIVNVFILYFTSENSRWLVILKKQLAVKIIVYINNMLFMICWSLFLLIITVIQFKFTIIPIGYVILSSLIASMIVNISLFTISINIKENSK